MSKVNNSLKKEKNTPMNVNKTIEKTAMETAKAIVAELRVQNMIKKN